MKLSGYKSSGVLQRNHVLPPAASPSRTSPLIKRTLLIGQIHRMEQVQIRIMGKLEAATMLLAFVIVPLSVLHTAEAVDFLFWDGPTCSGVVQNLCSSISNSTCCVSENAYQSVQVRADACEWTTTFKDGDCAANITINTNNGSVCFDSGGETYTAAIWELRCINGIPIVETPPVNETTNGTTPLGRRRRALLSDLRSEQTNSPRDCKRHVEVVDNVIYYREEPTKGMWILRVDGASKSELLEQLSNLPVEEKPFWLFSHGATYEFESEGNLFDIVEA